jgi:hypothetical protein
MDQRNLYRVASVELLNNYVRQGCEQRNGFSSFTLLPLHYEATRGEN